MVGGLVEQLVRSLAQYARPSAAALIRWQRANHAVPLTHLDPNEPLDDLEPLRKVIDGARIVAIGENSPFITEFA